MASDLLSKYIWLIDTIKRHGRITRQEINRAWMRSSLSDGQPIPRRTFYNYKQAIEDLFRVNIECDPATYEYYIAEGDEYQESMTNWLLNSTATNSILTSARDISSRVFLEDVPSAREHLATVMDSLRQLKPIKFDYHPYTRSRPTLNVVVEPYFVKIFKQCWYVVGRNVKEDKIKTYALDRIKNAVLMPEPFVMPADFDPAEYFDYAFGIVVDQSEPKTIRLKVDAMQAKYFRALPLHHTQQEMVNDQYSIFTYKMRVTLDLIPELLSYGSKIEVIEPQELRIMLKAEYQRALSRYE